MGEEKGGGYSNVAAINAWNKVYERALIKGARTRRLLDDTLRKKWREDQLDLDLALNKKYDN